MWFFTGLFEYPHNMAIGFPQKDKIPHFFNGLLAQWAVLFKVQCRKDLHKGQNKEAKINGGYLKIYLQQVGEKHIFQLWESIYAEVH